MSKKFLDLDGLSHFWLLIKNKLSGKVDKEYKTGSTSAYKVLSDNNLTDELLTKIQNAGDSSFSGNFNDLNNIPNEFNPSAHTHKKSEITDLVIPTKTSDLTNDSGYQTSSQVQTAINSALSGITGIDFQVVTDLPATGVKGTIYLKSNGGSNSNTYDEYVYVNNKWEKIGTTEVDLSGYLKDTDVTAIPNTEIDETCV